MSIFSRLEGEYEQLTWCHDATSGLRAIIAIHSTALGPALGGTRYYPYDSEDDALQDVLRLARGMTYKSAMAGLDLGGGKAVIIGNPARDKSEALLRTYGRFVDSLGGRYVTAEDVGTTQADMDTIWKETACVTGISPYLGGSGDPSDATAWGVYWAMQAVAAHLEGQDGPEHNLKGYRVVVAGVGKVGSALVGLLAEAGASVAVCDTNPDALSSTVDRFGVEAVDVEGAYAIECDLLAPCALGATLNDATVDQLACRAVVGSANNQLAQPQVADALAARGILYAPDFVVNAGGVIHIADGLTGHHPERSAAAVRRIGSTTTAVLRRAEQQATTTVAAAEALAEQRIEALRGVQRVRTFPHLSRA
jgi:leucine dehydrogenase